MSKINEKYLEEISNDMCDDYDSGLGCELDSFESSDTICGNTKINYTLEKINTMEHGVVYGLVEFDAVFEAYSTLDEATKRFEEIKAE